MSAFEFLQDSPQTESILTLVSCPSKAASVWNTSGTVPGQDPLRLQPPCEDGLGFCASQGLPLAYGHAGSASLPELPGAGRLHRECSSQDHSFKIRRRSCFT